MARVGAFAVFYGILLINLVAGQGQTQEALSREIEVLIGATPASAVSQPQGQPATNSGGQANQAVAKQRVSKTQPLEIIITTRPAASSNPTVVTTPTAPQPVASTASAQAVRAAPPATAVANVGAQPVPMAQAPTRTAIANVPSAPAAQFTKTLAHVTVQTVPATQAAAPAPPSVSPVGFQDNSVTLVKNQGAGLLPGPRRLDTDGSVPPAPVADGRGQLEPAAVPDGPAAYPDSIVPEGGPIGLGESGIGFGGPGCCDPCCGPQCAGFIFGAESLYLAPFDEPKQRVTLTNLVNADVRQGESDPGLGFGYRTWMGFKHCGRGFRLTYTHIGDSEQDVRPVVPTKATPAFHENYFLSGDTIDLEVTQDFCLCHMNLQASFGGRYARLDRSASVYGYGDLPIGDTAAQVFGYAMGSNEFEGSGFTFSLGAIKPIWCHCGWSAFWNWRGSLMWADSVSSALTEANAVLKVNSTAIGSANSRDKAFSSVDHTENIFTSEAQLGVQYSKCLCCFPGTFVFNAGIEFQHWRTGDLRAATNSFATLLAAPPLVGGRVDASSRAHDGDLDLLGLFIGAGFIY